MTIEHHWGLASHGERVRHEGEYENCTEDNCLAGKATSPEGRVRLAMRLLEETGVVSVGGDFIYDPRFNTEDWPSQGYPVLREDVQDVLRSLDMAREMRDANAGRYEAGAEGVSQLVDLVASLTERLVAREKAMAKQVGDLKNLVSALKRHGGEHWFAYGYQKVIDLPTGPYVDHCSECDKPRLDPSHFGNGVTALSSKTVEEAVRATTTRLTSFLASGLNMSPEMARETARELLESLPQEES